MSKCELHPEYARQKAKLEALLTRRNAVDEDFYNGIYDRWQNPVLTREMIPLEWRFDLDPKTNPYFIERLGVNAVFNASAIKQNGKYYLIARIEGNTTHIFEIVRKRPETLGEIRKIMNYYLPTTLKLLDSYAKFEEAGIEGENLSRAQERIEETMDALIKGFDKQLDDLYRNEAMDIDSDIRVMENMLRRDTASVEDDFGLGGAAVQRAPDEEYGAAPLSYAL